MLKVYVTRPGGADTEAAVARLPRWRRERTERIAAPASRRLSVAAGLLWRYAVEAAQADPEAPVRLLGAGRPVFADGGLFFSLSHSGDRALCAVSDRPVGADVQEPRPVKLGVARRFRPEEYAALAALPAEELPAALLALWARKEAWVKAESRGRMLALDEADLLDPPAPWVVTDGRFADGSFWAVCAGERAEEPVELPFAALL